MELEISISPRI